MAGKPVVFLGPTLPAAQAEAILEAVYLPPAEQGSMVRVVREHSPSAIVLVDGAFGKVPAVRHKELLWALACGIPVLGAASMGAIRAAELAPFGMRGHGFLYRWYALTALADDDEVAVAMSPPELGSAALSEALVNIRLTLARAQREGIVSEAQRRFLEGVARDTHFVDRSYPRLLANARALLRGAEQSHTAHSSDVAGATGTPAPPHTREQREGHGRGGQATPTPDPSPQRGGGPGAPLPASDRAWLLPRKAASPSPLWRGVGVGVFPGVVAPREWEDAFERLEEWLPGGAVDRKREDAVGLLTLLARRPGLLERRPDAPPLRLTEAWAHDLDAAGLWGDDIASILDKENR